MRKFYTVDELALASGVSVGTIRNRIKDGTLFAVQSKDRGAFRIPVGAYQRYLAGLGLAPTRLLANSQFLEELCPVEVADFALKLDLWLLHAPELGNLSRALEVLGRVLVHTFEIGWLSQGSGDGRAGRTRVASRAASALGKHR